MRHFSLVLALLAGCAGGGELQQPNPPPEWPLGGADPAQLPDGTDVTPPTAPPAALAEDTDAATASDTEATEEAPPSEPDGDAPSPPAPDGAPAAGQAPDGDDAH